MAILQGIVHGILGQMRCSPLPGTQPLLLWYGHWCSRNYFPADHVDITNGLTAAFCSIQTGKRNDRSNLKAESSNAIRGSHEFLEKMTCFVATEMLLLIAHI